MTIKIRKATIKDAEGILKLEKEWDDENISYGIFLPKDRLIQIRKEIKKQIWFIAEQDKLITGFIQGEIIKAKRFMPSFEIKKREKFGELHAVYISKKFRGEKIGDKLIEELLGEFRKNKIKKVKLKAVSKNVFGLVKYYKNCGFEERHVDMVKELK